MTKNINIKITLTDEPIDIGNTQRTGPNSWHITVSNKDAAVPDRFKAEDTTLPILAHEVGHAVGQAVAGSIMSEEDKFMKGFFGIVTPSLVKEEKRAWAIGKDVFDAVKNHALGTYENAVTEQ